ncbi:hypothetical protein JKG68_25495 [Microvirga aerilata]|uniref:Uncharacterized protein n=1 Tax=Microvirga aerilata TaxID=670292 RepID=A0A936ZHS0_9HYPH|nr:hypothetical protein [Microvirga aerilata]MBL0407284.1 hypothetical protein [Microvirga aerilata]
MRVGARRGVQREGTGTVLPGKPRDGERVVVIDPAERLLRAGLADRGSQGADHAIDSPPWRIGRQVLEIDQRVFELRMRR